MKTKLFLLSILSLLTSTGFSLNATYNPANKTKVITVGFNEFWFEGVEITNTSTENLDITYTLIQNDTLSDCFFTMCASGTCKANVPQTGNLNTIGAGQTGWLKLHTSTGTTVGSNIFKFILSDGGSQDDTLTLIINVLDLSSTQTIIEEPKETMELLRNTVSEKLLVTINDKFGNDNTLSIVNMSGAEVQSYAVGAAMNNLDISTLPPGIYFVNYRNSSATITKRFVVY